jgi:hypothetical protein
VEIVDINVHRVKRETRGSESLLTVEWEGIQRYSMHVYNPNFNQLILSGDHPDSSIRGFIVEYKVENESQWNVHSGMFL